MRSKSRVLDVLIVCPAPRGSRMGNRVTANRWFRVLRALGHHVRIATGLDAQPYDVLVALHACKSAAAVLASRRERPDAAIVLALTGTDVYGGIRGNADAHAALAAADRIVTLQSAAERELPKALRARVRVIHQSCEPLRVRVARAQRGFEIAVIGHLRDEKDPMRAAEASRDLPSASRIRVVHVGRALTDRYAKLARDESRANPRYRWLGERSRSEARRRIARAHGLVLSSVLEGGANVLSEAIVLGTPILASRIPSTVAILGSGYQGYFEVRDTEGLRALMLRLENDPAFRRTLSSVGRALKPMFAPSREQDAWRRLLGELVPSRR